MLQEDWVRVKELFERAVEMDPAVRSRFLDEACGIDTERRRLVESMLDADEAPPSVLQMPHDSLSTLVDDATAEDLPDQIGPYEVIDVIGRGGMGLVVRGKRIDLPKQVALKLIGQRWYGPQLLERFRREQSVLARLQHPNIAQLLDAGTGAEGIPYFAMEYVDGMPLNAYCDAQDLTIRQRLALFLTVCDAVQFAHRNLVIHRDLKPSNILVNTEGRVKLLDFGISKLIDDEGPVLTVTDFRALTPSYASPEQILGEPVTTSSDVYSLGVVLYELLAGRRPFSLSGKSATEVARILSQESPTRPSVRAAQSEDGAAFYKSAGRALSGDIDNIILKALEKSPTARYASVEAFAADIHRYLDGLPVEARAATFGYRTGKFIALHRWGVGVAVALVVLLVAFAASVTYQQAQTASERDRAELEAAKSERVVEFMLGLFEASDPSEALGDEITARELLERGIERAQTLSDQPLLQAETYHVVGRVYESLGLYERAAELSQKAVDLRRSALGEHHPEVAESLELLASARGGLRNVKGAISAASEALSIAEHQGDDPGISVATALGSLAEAYVTAGQYERADSLLSASYEMLSDLLGASSEQAMRALARRGLLLTEAGLYPESEAVNRTVLAWQRENLPKLHPRIAQTLNDLGVAIKSQSRFEEAQPFYEEALEIQRTVYGNGHPLTAASLRNLAIFHGIQGEYETSEIYFREALNSFEQAFGRVSPRTASIVSAYAVLLGRTGRNSEAQDRYREALTILEESLGPRHPETINTLYNLGLSLGKGGEYVESLPLLKRAVQLSRVALDATHHDLPERLGGLAVIESRAGRHGDAEQHAREAVSLDLKHRGKQHRRYALRLGQLGRVLLNKRDYSAADSVLTRSLTLHVEATSDDHPETLTIRDALGRAKVGLGSYQEAESLLSQAYQQRLEHLGPDHPDTKASIEHLEGFQKLAASFNAGSAS